MKESVSRCVVLAMPRVPHYRVPLLERLRERLEQRGIRLRVVHAQAPEESGHLEQDYVQLAWTESVRARRVPGSHGRAIWHSISVLADDANLVVVPEVAGWLPTYPLLALRHHQGYRVACWGHGPDTDDHAPLRLSRSVRSALARRFDWWFSYTNGTTGRLLSAGVPRERITTLHNTIDVAALRSQVNLARAGSAETRKCLSLEGPTAVYVGALHASKRIGMLLAAAERIAERVAGFTLVVCGDGPERHLIEAALATSPWLRYVGPVVGTSKARILAVADLMLRPAWLGLVVLDAFAAGLPVVTLDRANHSPEEEYLRDGVEGIRVQGDDPQRLADAVVELLNDPARLAILAEGAWCAGSKHSIEEMSDRFADGIESALR